MKRHGKRFNRCGLKIYANIDDNFSRDYISKSIGDTEVAFNTSSIAQARSRSMTISEGVSESYTDNQSSTDTTGSTNTEGHTLQSSQSKSRGTSISDGYSESRVIQKALAKLIPLMKARPIRGISKGRTRSQSEGKSKGRNFDSGIVGFAEAARECLFSDR